MTDGILYKATGQKYVDEAINSAKSVNKNTPELDTALVTDNDIDSDVFDHVIINSGLRKDVSSSILSPSDSPFDRTLYLDTDTHVFADISDLFAVLDDYDLAVTISGDRRPLPGKPEPYREFNTGVILYKCSKKANNFLSLWDETYWEYRNEQDIISNQPAFSLAVHESDLNVFILPREYNCFVNSIGFLAFDAKILHGRPQHTLPDTGEKINSKLKRRVFYTIAGPRSINTVKMYTRKRERFDSRFFSSLRKNGLRYTLKAGTLELLGKRNPPKGSRYADGEFKK